MSINDKFAHDQVFLWNEISLQAIVNFLDRYKHLWIFSLFHAQKIIHAHNNIFHLVLSVHFRWIQIWWALCAHWLEVKWSYFSSLGGIQINIELFLIWSIYLFGIKTGIFLIWIRINNAQEFFSCVNQELSGIGRENFFIFHQAVSFEKSHKDHDRESTHVLKDAFQLLKNIYIQGILNFLNPPWMRKLKLRHFSEVIKIDLRTDFENKTALIFCDLL